MRKLATVFLLAALLPAQEDVIPADDDTTAHRCVGCSNIRAGSFGDGAIGEIWRYIPKATDRPGKCYARFDYKGCSATGCKFDGHLQLHLSPAWIGPNQVRRWVFDGQSGIIASGEKSPWLTAKFTVGCGLMPPTAFAFDLYNPSAPATSGYKFRCGSCFVDEEDDGSILDDEGQIIR